MLALNSRFLSINRRNAKMKESPETGLAENDSGLAELRFPNR